MAWLRIDDKLHSKDKFAGISLEATGLWLLCLSWSGDHLTDGRLPAGIVARYGGPKGKKLAAELVAAVLWDETDTGHQIHDYLDYNPSKADVEAEREAAKERMHRARAAKRSPELPDNTQECSEDVRANNNGTSGEVRVTPIPIPYPDPELALSVTEDNTAADTSGGCGGKGQAAGGGGCMPDGWEGAEHLPPDALLARFQQAFPEKTAELAAALASANGTVKSQPAFLRPVILRLLRNEQPAPITPAARSHLPLTPTEQRLATSVERSEAFFADIADGKLPDLTAVTHRKMREMGLNPETPESPRKEMPRALRPH